MEAPSPSPSTPKKGGNSVIFIIIAAALLLVVTIGSTFLLSSKIEKSNEKIVVVDEESKDRDDKLDKKIDDLSSVVADSLEAVNKRMVEMEKTLNGKIWYLQDQVNKNKKAVEDLNSSVEELKAAPAPVAVVDEPAKKSSKKKRKSSGFDFSELENIGEEFEEMFQ